MIQSQRGAVLIVSLILLLLITAIAASVLISSTFQTKISANMQQRESVFRVAESATEQVLPLTVANAASAIAASPTTGVTVAVATTQPNVDTPAAKIYYPGDALAKRPLLFPGVAVGCGGGGGVVYVARNYDVRGDATSSDTHIHSQVDVGVSRVEPDQCE